MNIGLPEISAIALLLLIFTGGKLTLSKKKKSKKIASSSSTKPRAKANYESLEKEYPKPEDEDPKSTAA